MFQSNQYFTRIKKINTSLHFYIYPYSLINNQICPCHPKKGMHFLLRGGGLNAVFFQRFFVVGGNIPILLNQNQGV